MLGPLHAALVCHPDASCVPPSLNPQALASSSASTVSISRALAAALTEGDASLAAAVASALATAAAPDSTSSLAVALAHVSTLRPQTLGCLCPLAFTHLLAC